MSFFFCLHIFSHFKYLYKDRDWGFEIHWFRLFSFMYYSLTHMFCLKEKLIDSLNRKQSFFFILHKVILFETGFNVKYWHFSQTKFEFQSSIVQSSTCCCWYVRILNAPHEKWKFEKEKDNIAIRTLSTCQVH